MTRASPLRLALAAVGVVVLAWIGWTTVQATRADELAATDPEAALRLDPEHPKALLALGRRQLARGENDAASATARRLLAVEPGQGEAFAVLALAAARRGDADAPALARIALQRAPRDRELRALEAATRLKEGDLEGGLQHIDAFLRLSPARGPTLYPALAEQAQDAAFADALARTLARNPPWRNAFMAALDRSGKQAAIDNVHGRLQQQSGLSEAELARWIDRMIADKRWGDAFARWLSLLPPGTTHVPPVRNGGFEEDPSPVGFQWRNDRGKGVVAEIEEGAGLRGSRAARFHFFGETARGNLRQALLLPPGRYRLSLQARAEFLRSDRGLQWTVRCDGAGLVARTEAMEGSFEWREFTATFEIPKENCPGQWLELTNPAVSGSARQVSGDLWVDEVAIAAEGGAVGR